jgi:transposase-like protein
MRDPLKHSIGRCPFCKSFHLYFNKENNEESYEPVYDCCSCGVILLESEVDVIYEIRRAINSEAA